MGVEWGLQMVRPDTLEAIDDTVFDPHPIEEGELDLILVGEEEGPIFDLLSSGARGATTTSRTSIGSVTIVLPRPSPRKPCACARIASRRSRASDTCRPRRSSRGG